MSRVAVRWTVAVVVLLSGILAIDETAVASATLRREAVFAVVELGRLAGVRGDDGTPTGATVTLAVVQEGGPMWIGEAVAAAVDADGALRRGDAPHVLEVEVVAQPPVYLVRLALWRRGWSIGAPDPVVARAAPWLAWIALAIAALAVARGLRPALAIAASGALAQAMTLALPWPGPGARPGLIEQWQDGPLAQRVLALAQGMPAWATTVGIGIVVACLVLAVFDHRRSRHRGGWLVVLGLIAVVGVVAWIEAAFRVGVAGSLEQIAGWIAAAGAIGLVVTALQARHRAAA